jgi:hypothetical protein
MDFADSVDELQEIAENRRARKILRASGIGAILFGVLALAIGIPLLAVDLLNVVLVGIGVLLLIEGIWNVSLPTAEGIIVDGIALILVGVWNIFIAFLSVLVNNPEPIRWGILGAVQIGYGIYRFTTYPRFYAALRHHPEPEDLKLMDKLVKQIQKTKTKATDDHIAFQTKGFLQQQVWKGQLARAAALFVDQTGHEVMVLHEDQFEMTVRGKVLIGKTLKVSVRFKDRVTDGLISPEEYAKYESWKGREGAARSAEE